MEAFTLTISQVICRKKNNPDLTYFLAICAEILVLGTGARLERINPLVLALLKEKGIAVEIQDTVQFSYFLQ